MPALSAISPFGDPVQSPNGEWTHAGPDGDCARPPLRWHLISDVRGRRAGIEQVAVEEFRQIGVEAIPQTEAFEALLSRVVRSRDPALGDRGGHDYDAMVMTWAQMGPDPDAFWYWHSQSIQGGAGNRVGYQNATVDQAIDDGRTRCTPAERKTAYHRMDLQLNEDQPLSFGLVADSLLVVNKHIHGVEVGAYSFWAQWNVERWWRST